MKIPPLYNGGIFILADMKNYILIFIYLISSAGFSQEAKCGYYGKKTVSERNQIFPFSKAKKIVLISYKNCEMMSPLADSLTLDEARAIDINVIKKYEFPLKDLLSEEKYVTSQSVYFTLEEVVLDGKMKDELSNTLCNYIFIKGKGRVVVEEVKCAFIPRNSILFFDENESLICVYDICFQCMQSAFLPDPERLNGDAQISECHGRLDEVKKLFSKNGIVYGIPR